MLVEDLILEVRGPDLRRAGFVDLNDATLEIRSEFCNVGTWKLTLVSDHPTINVLRTPGSGITVRAHGEVWFSGRHDGRTAKATFDDPEGTVTFEGISDDHILGDRLAYPVPTSATMAGQKAAANDVRSGKLETVMHSFVRANVGPEAPAARRHPQLDMGPDLGRGPEVKRSTRFAKLGNLLRDIVVLGDLGFRVIQRGTRLAFETYGVTDRTKTIRMDVWNGTLESYEATSVGASVTHVIVAGQEEGVNRQLLERTSAESLAQERLWNRRIELFLDQRHTDDLEELAQAGDEELAKNGVAQSAVKFVPMDDGTMEFLKDWFVGDRVTAVVEDREVPAIVSAAVLRVDQDGVAVMCALGDINGASSTEGFISRTESRLSALERTAENAKIVPAENVEGSVLTLADGDAEPSLRLHRQDGSGPLRETRIYTSIAPTAEAGIRLVNDGVAGTTLYVTEGGVLGVHDGTRRRNAPFAQAAGSASIAATGVTTVTFPSGRFTQPPVVMATVTYSNGQVAFPFRSSPATAAGFQVRIFNYNGVQVAGTVDWTAVQMTPTTSAG